MKATHTPGEWYFYDSNKRSFGGYSAGQWVSFELATKFSEKPLDTASIGKISFTAKGGNIPEDYAQCEANAKLMAAAPELLEALIHANEIIDRLCEDYATVAKRHANFTNGEARKITNAIQKATL